MSYFDHFRALLFCQALFTETLSASSENLWGHHLDGSCHCTLRLPPCSLNDGVHYAGANVNVTAILEGERALGELPFVTAFPKSLPQRHWAHLPCPSAHKRSKARNISCCSLGYFGGERSPWSDLVFSNKCALCCCSLLRDNTAQAESSAWPLIEHKCCFVRPRVIT